MALKQFFITISSREDLNPKYYVDDQSGKKSEKQTCYTSIPMLDKYISEGDDVEIIPIRIEDKNHRSRTNLKKFIDEVESLLKEKKIKYTKCVDYQKDENGNAVLEKAPGHEEKAGRPIIEYTKSEKLEKVVICEEILVPHEETREKQIETFKKITKRYKEGSEVFADITFGSKALPVCIIASLHYADILCKCNIKKIIYGQYTYDNSETATVYDVRSLFEISAMTQTMKFINREKADELLDGLWH